MDQSKSRSERVTLQEVVGLYLFRKPLWLPSAHGDPGQLTSTSPATVLIWVFPKIRSWAGSPPQTSVAHLEIFLGKDPPAQLLRVKRNLMAISQSMQNSTPLRSPSGWERWKGAASMGKGPAPPPWRQTFLGGGGHTINACKTFAALF